MLNENLSYEGIWFNPESPDLKFAGTLNYDPRIGITLKYIGNLRSVKLNSENSPLEFDLININTVLGYDINGKKITLVDSREISWKSEGPGLRTATLNVKYAFIGKEYFDFENTRLKTTSFETTIFKNWLWKTGYKRELVADTIFDFNISYRRVNKIIYQINTNFDLIFEVAAKMEDDLNEYIIKETPVITFKYSQPINFVDVLKDYDHIKYFFCFTFFKTTTPLSIFVWDVNKIKYLVLAHHTQNGEQTSNIRSFLFNYEESEHVISQLLSSWYSKREKYITISSLIYNNFEGNNSIENLFLNIIQAIEYFHRIFINNEIEPENIYKAKKKAILDTVDLQYKEWLQNKLQHSNEPSLKVRIENLVNRVSFTKVNILFNVSDIKKIVNTRNLLNHSGDLTTDDTIRDQEDYLETIDKLRALLIVNILYELVGSEEWISNLVEKNLGRISSYISF